MFKRLIVSFVTISFILSYYQPVYAQDFSVNELPVPGTMVGVSVPFTPLALKGLVINTQKPLEFQFIVDTGHGPQDTAAVKEQANQLVKYFLAGLTIPEGDLWVNLSPYEKNRLVPEALGQTDLGRDLLAQDYILKQLTASLIYPEKDLGKEFWSRVYARAQQQFGTTNVPVNTFNKVWILPDQAQVFEHGVAAYVTKATMKVMLDEDYLALQKHVAIRNGTDSIGSQIVREIVIPEITKEVNTGKNFALLRQIYQALILAKWYKETIQNGLLDAVYTNKNKVAGVDLNDPTVKEQIYDRYLKAYKKGAFNYIKEDPTPEEQVVPRKYFSGGTSMAMTISKTHDRAMIGSPEGIEAVISIDLKITNDAAMAAEAGGKPTADGAMTVLVSRKQYAIAVGLLDKDYNKISSANPVILYDGNDKKGQDKRMSSETVGWITSMLLKQYLKEKRIEATVGGNPNFVYATFPEGRLADFKKKDFLDYCQEFLMSLGQQDTIGSKEQALVHLSVGTFHKTKKLINEFHALLKSYGEAFNFQGESTKEQSLPTLHQDGKNFLLWFQESRDDENDRYHLQTFRDEKIITIEEINKQLRDIGITATVEREEGGLVLIITNTGPTPITVTYTDVVPESIKKRDTAQLSNPTDAAMLEVGKTDGAMKAEKKEARKRAADDVMEASMIFHSANSEMFKHQRKIVTKGIISGDPYKTLDQLQDPLYESIVNVVADYSSGKTIINFDNHFGLVMIDTDIYPDARIYSDGYIDCYGFAVRARLKSTRRIDVGLTHILSDGPDDYLEKSLFVTQKELEKEGYEVLEYVIAYRNDRRTTDEDLNYQRTIRNNIQKKYPHVKLRFKSSRKHDVTADEGILVSQDSVSITDFIANRTRVFVWQGDAAMNVYQISDELKKRIAVQLDFFVSSNSETTGFPFPHHLGNIAGMPEDSGFARALLHVPGRAVNRIFDVLVQLEHNRYAPRKDVTTVYEDFIQEMRNLREWCHLWSDPIAARQYLLTFRRQFSILPLEIRKKIEHGQGEGGLVNSYEAMRFAWDEKRNDFTNEYQILRPHFEAMRDSFERDYPELLSIINEFASANGVPKDKIVQAWAVPSFMAMRDRQELIDEIARIYSSMLSDFSEFRDALLVGSCKDYFEHILVGAWDHGGTFRDYLEEGRFDHVLSTMDSLQRMFVEYSSQENFPKLKADAKNKVELVKKRFAEMGSSLEEFYAYRKRLGTPKEIPRDLELHKLGVFGMTTPETLALFIDQGGLEENHSGLVALLNKLDPKIAKIKEIISVLSSRQTDDAMTEEALDQEQMSQIDDLWQNWYSQLNGFGQLSSENGWLSFVYSLRGIPAQFRNVRNLIDIELLKSGHESSMDKLKDEYASLTNMLEGFGRTLHNMSDIQKVSDWAKRQLAQWDKLPDDVKASLSNGHGAPDEEQTGLKNQKDMADFILAGKYSQFLADRMKTVAESFDLTYREILIRYNAIVLRNGYPSQKLHQLPLVLANDLKTVNPANVEEALKAAWLNMDQQLRDFFNSPPEGVSDELWGELGLGHVVLAPMWIYGDEVYSLVKEKNKEEREKSIQRIIEGLNEIGNIIDNLANPSKIYSPQGNLSLEQLLASMAHFLKNYNGMEARGKRALRANNYIAQLVLFENGRYVSEIERKGKELEEIFSNQKAYILELIKKLEATDEAMITSDSIKRTFELTGPVVTTDAGAVYLLKRLNIEDGDQILTIGPGKMVAHVVFTALQKGRVEVLESPIFQGNNEYFGALERIKALDAHIGRNILTRRFSNNIQASKYDCVVMVNLNGLPVEQIKQIIKLAIKAVQKEKFIIINAGYVQMIKDVDISFKEIYKARDLVLLEHTIPLPQKIAARLNGGLISSEQLESYINAYRSGIFPQEKMSLFKKIDRYIQEEGLDGKERINMTEDAFLKILESSLQLMNRPMRSGRIDSAMNTPRGDQAMTAEGIDMKVSPALMERFRRWAAEMAGKFQLVRDHLQELADVPLGDERNKRTEAVFQEIDVAFMGINEAVFNLGLDESSSFAIPHSLKKSTAEIFAKKNVMKSIILGFSNFQEKPIYNRFINEVDALRYKLENFSRFRRIVLTSEASEASGRYYLIDDASLRDAAMTGVRGKESQDMAMKSISNDYAMNSVNKIIQRLLSIEKPGEVSDKYISKSRSLLEELLFPSDKNSPKINITTLTQVLAVLPEEKYSHVGLLELRELLGMGSFISKVIHKFPFPMTLSQKMVVWNTLEKMATKKISTNSIERFKMGFPLILKGGFDDLGSYMVFQNAIGDIEINIEVIRPKKNIEPVLVICRGFEDAAKSRFGVVSSIDGHTHGFSTPLEYSDADKEHAESLADQTGAGEFILAVNKSKGELISKDFVELAHYDVKKRDWKYYRNPSPSGQNFIRRKLIQLGVIKSGNSAQVSQNGGIDLNQINVNRTGRTIHVQFDPAQLNELEQSNFKGFTPVVTGFEYIQSPFPLLGINTPAKEPEVLVKT